MYTIFTTPQKATRLIPESLKLFKTIFLKALLPTLLFIGVTLIQEAYVLLRHTPKVEHAIYSSILRIAIMLLCSMLAVWIIRKIDLTIKNVIESLSRTITFSIKKGIKIFLIGFFSMLLFIAIPLAFFFILALFQMPAKVAFFLAAIITLPFIIYFSLPILFSYYKIVVDERRIFSAIKQSFQLIYGKWWRTFGTFLLPFLLLMLIIIIIMIPVAISVAMMHLTTIQVQWIILGIMQILYIFLLPWMYSFIYLVYHNLKLLKQLTQSITQN